MLSLRSVPGHAPSRRGLLYVIAMLTGLAGAAIAACSGSSGTSDVAAGSGVDGSLDAASSDTSAVTCGAGQMVCAGACTDTARDPMNCGGCDQKCAVGEACVAGKCGLACAGDTTKCGIACAPGYDVCGGDGGPTFCASTATDNANCGSCGHACAPGLACAAGVCAVLCPASDTKCTPDGGADAAPYCAVTSTDNANCGACFNACGAGTTCMMGKCVTDCPSPGTTCDAGVCVDTSTDPRNCGGCGISCAGGKACCAAGCTDLSTDPNNCNACGRICSLPNATSGCGAGLCTIASCDQNFADCDLAVGNGCEVNTTNDPSNCGGCKNACAVGATCMGGKCMCPANKTACNGACVDVASDALNCGKCNNACLPGHSCTAGLCL